MTCVKHQLKNVLRTVLRPLDAGLSKLFGRRTFAQMGEDIIVDSLCHTLWQLDGRTADTYIDIGAHDAFALSNTALLYLNGWHGLLVEPNPALAGRLRRQRPRDMVLEAGVGLIGGVQLPFYVFEPDVLSTFSVEDARRYEDMRYSRRATLTVPVMTLNEVLALMPDAGFLSIDIEGLDAEVVMNTDWSANRPRIICIETIIHALPPKKNLTGVRHLESCGYLVLADTYVNSILVDEGLWTRVTENAPNY